MDRGVFLCIIMTKKEHGVLLQLNYFTLKINKMIKLILAPSDNNIIGLNEPVDNSLLPWHLPSDMKRFSKTTKNTTVVMGRRTWESLPDEFRPLPNRENYVLTRNKDLVCDRATVVYDIKDIVDHANNNPQKDIFIIGGTEIYNQFLPHADEIYLTRVHIQVPVSDNTVLGPELNFTKFGNPDGFFLASCESFQDDSIPNTFYIFKRKLDKEDIENLRIQAKKKFKEPFVMGEYENLLKHILYKGDAKLDRTGTGTVSVFGYQMRFDLKNSFPLITTKEVNLRSIIYELLWFIKGDTNIKYLVDNGVGIWNDWPYDKYKKSKDFQGESIKEFAAKIKNDNDFAEKWGNLGPVYGKQWRDWDGIDQLLNLINQLKNNPDSRRHIISAWNPTEVDRMALPPCHCLFQFYVVNNKLSCQLYQRSADVFLGVPFNIASYALLTQMIACAYDFELGEFIHTFGDLHIYANHFDQVVTQLNRSCYSRPQMIINPEVKSIFDFKFEDFTLKDYECHPPIRAEVAV